MKVKNILLSVLFIILLFSAITPVLADDFSGTLTVNIDKTSLKVGDTVNIYVTASNDGLGDWTDLKIYAPIPPGLQYVSHDMPDRTVKEYDPNTGIWNVYQMRDTNRGKLKEMIVTCIVLPEASGDNIVATARFYSLRWHGTNAEGRIAMASSPVAVVAYKDPDPPPKPPPKPPKNDTPGTDGEGGIGDKSGSGVNGVNNYGNTLFVGALKNMTASNNKEPLLNSRTGGGNNGKKFEVFEDLNKTDSRYVYVLAALMIVGLIIIGYYYGIKRDS